MATTHTITRMIRRPGIAGQFAIDVDYTVTRDGFTSAHETTFVGSAYGGPVIAIVDGQQIFVSDPTRFGSEFGTEWVRNYFAETATV